MNPLQAVLIQFLALLLGLLLLFGVSYCGFVAYERRRFDSLTAAAKQRRNRNSHDRMHAKNQWTSRQAKQLSMAMRRPIRNHRMKAP